jgi:hypothetical protein
MRVGLYLKNYLMRNSTKMLCRVIRIDSVEVRHTYNPVWVAGGATRSTR